MSGSPWLLRLLRSSRSWRWPARSLRHLLVVGSMLLGVSGAGAVAYPLQVVDLAGRTVVVQRAPQRIFLQNGNDLMTLTLLEREDPFARLAGWDNGLGDSDPSIWQLVRQRWPSADRVPLLDFDNSGHVDLEALVRLRPDLVLADITARSAIEGGPIGPILERLGIALLYIDSSRDPVGNVQRTIALLGKVLDREQRAEDYLRFYRQRFDALQAGIALERHRPDVFIEIRAGRMGLDQCCYSQGKTSWGLLIAAVGGRNIATRLLSGATGDIPLETLIRLQPDVYLMTGTQRIRRGAHSVPFGYGASEDAAQAGISALMARPGFSATAKAPGARVHALYHQFYNSAFNIVALEYLAQALYPQRFAELTPDATYRELIARFTTLPDAPFVFRATRAYSGAAYHPDQLFDR
ncbi:MAG: ABC transporter substrate-binding protein [Pseudomonadota bacterium]